MRWDVDTFLATLKDHMDGTPELMQMDFISEAFHTAKASGYIGTEDNFRDEFEDKNIWDNLSARVAELYAQNILPFYISDDHDSILNDGAAFETAKIDCLAYINKSTPLFFEKICSVLLYLYDFSKVETTALSNDAGIDFIAKKNILSANKESGFSEIIVFGQAKRYGKTKISIGSLREFLGATEIIRCGGYKDLPDNIKRPAVDYKNYKPFSAHARMFVTSGSITNNAKIFAEWLGLRVVNGDELARTFHHHRIGFSRTRTNVHFNKDIFKERINTLWSQISASTPSSSPKRHPPIVPPSPASTSTA